MAEAYTFTQKTTLVDQSSTTTDGSANLCHYGIAYGYAFSVLLEDP